MMWVSYGRCITSYFIIVGLISCLATLAPAYAVTKDHNKILEDPTLVRRYDVVSSEQYRNDCLRAGRVQRLPGVFWTSFPTKEVPLNKQGFLTTRAWGKSYFGSADAFVMYDTASNTFQALNQVDEICDMPTPAEYALQTRRISKGFAAACHGTAYLLMPDGASFNFESVWYVWEWPTLTRNPAMEELITVFYPSGVQFTSWKRMDGPKPQGINAPPGRRKIKA